MRLVIRWIPFALLFLGLAVLAEVDSFQDAFLARYGLMAWDRLHWYGSATLVVAAFFALPRRYGTWRRLLTAIVLVLSAGLLREVRQSFESGPNAFSRHDLNSNWQGAVVGAALSTVWSWVSGRGKAEESSN